MRPPEALGAQHQQEGFDCGNAALNRRLLQRALANERQGVSRTVVLCSDEGKAVIAHACLSAGAIVLADAAALRTNRLIVAPSPRATHLMAYRNIEAILEDSGDITVGRVGPSADAGAARGSELCGAAVATGSLDRHSLGPERPPPCRELVPSPQDITTGTKARPWARLSWLSL